MKNFTYYEANKLLNETIRNNTLDIDYMSWDDCIDSPELSKLLDISESTANNWLLGRSEISKLGKQAIGYQLFIDIIRAYKQKKIDKILTLDNEKYHILSPSKDGVFENLATTQDIQIARYIQTEKNILKYLYEYMELLDEEIFARGDDCNQYLKERKRDLLDILYYIEKGITYSEKMENDNRERMKELENMLSNNKNKATSLYQNNFSDFGKYCEQKYGKDTILYNLITNLLNKIKANFVLLQKDTKWVSDGEYKNFIAIKAQNKNFCITIKDKSRKLKATTFQIKKDRIPYIRFNIEKMEQLEEAATIINASLKNV